MASISEYIFQLPISLRTCNRQSDNRLRPSRKSGLLFWVALKRAEYYSFVKDGKKAVVKLQVVRDDFPVLVFSVIKIFELNGVQRE